jgi:DNA-binding transcriptional MerR regulator
MMKLSDWLNVTQAAKYLGVCSETLRRWDRSGKLTPSRHPINGYRLYDKAMLDQVLATLQGGAAS